MADDTQLNPIEHNGGDVIRTIEKGARKKTQVVTIDLGGAGAEDLISGHIPVQDSPLLTELEKKADLSETQPVSLAGKSTEAKQDDAITVLTNLLTELMLKANLTEKQPVNIHDEAGVAFSASNPLSSRIMDRNGNIISDVVPSLVTTEVDHFLIHMGAAFIHSEIHLIPSGNTLDHIMVNTTDLEVHLSNFHITSTQGNGTLVFYKGVTSDDMGTEKILTNKNFNSANTATLTLGYDPITNLNIPANSSVQSFLITGGKQDGGSLPSGIDEFVLKKDEKCLLRYTNNGNATDTVVIDIGTLDVGLLLASL